MAKSKNHANPLSFKLRLGLIIGGLILGFMIFGLATFKAMNTLNVNGPLYERIVQGKDIIADVLPPPEYIIESYLLLLQITQTEDVVKIEGLKKRFEILKNEYETRHQYWLNQHLEDKLHETLLKRSYLAAQTFYKEAEQVFFPALQNANKEAALASLLKIEQSYETHRLAIGDVVNFTTERNSLDEANARDTIDWYSFLLVSVFGFSVIASGIASFFVIRDLIKQLGIDPFYAKGMALEIAKGHLGRTIELEANDTSSLLYAMKKMQQEIVLRMSTANKLIDEVTRVKIALDNVNTGVMIADNDRVIIYANKAVVKLLSKLEADIKKQVPHFSVEKLVGSNIDLFHKKPEHQASQLASMQTTLKSNLELHGHHLVVTASPVIDTEGRRLGTAAEWLDRTDEVRVEHEVAAAIKAAVNGDFSFRIDSGELQGFYEQAGTGINQLMQTCHEGLNDVARVLGAIAKGDLTQTITNEYLGTFGLLKENANTTTEKLKGIIGEIRDVSANINTGSKEIASGNNDLSHRTEEQAASLEQTAASMHELTTTVQLNTENAKRANSLAISAAQIAGEGGNLVQQVVVTMEEINTSSRKIVDIISVIDGIAFQTNILALNAAVEAARAGDQGRGFAVVASEVRNLAQRAAAAAREIKNLISDSVDKVEEGTELVNHAGVTMVEIVNAIKGVTAMMASINKASEEQGNGIAQVNLAITQMDDVTQQNAALVEQAAAAAESLEEQAQSLVIAVNNFKVDEYSSQTFSTSEF